jgi:hypothetical protein
LVEEVGFDKKEISLSRRRWNYPPCVAKDGKIELVAPGVELSSEALLPIFVFFDPMSGCPVPCHLKRYEGVAYRPRHNSAAL